MTRRRRIEPPRPPLEVGEEAWWFVTSPCGRNADGKNRRVFQGAARVRVVETTDVDTYRVEVLLASGAHAGVAKDLGTRPVVHRRDLFRCDDIEEHRAFGDKVALATRSDRG